MSLVALCSVHVPKFITLLSLQQRVRLALTVALTHRWMNRKTVILADMQRDRQRRQGIKKKLQILGAGVIGVLKCDPRG